MMRYLSPAGRLAPRRTFQFVCVLLGAAAWFPHFANAAILRPGDLLVTDAGIDNSQTNLTANGAIFHVDPSTGYRTIISGRGVGGGPGLFDTRGIVVGLDGYIYVSDTGYDEAQDRFRDRIIRVDPITGNRVVVSGAGIGDGPEFRDPPSGSTTALPGLVGLTIDQNGALLAGESRDPVEGAAIYRVDPLTGERQLVSGLGTGVGEALNGSTFDTLAGATELIVDPRNPAKLLVSGESLLSLDVATGDWFELAGDLGEFSQVFAALGGIDVTRDGRFVILGDDGVLFTFDRDTSQLASLVLVGDSSQPDVIPLDLAFTPGQTSAYANSGDSLARVDLVTGTREIISGVGIGTGPQFESLVLMHVIVPEPTGTFLVVSALPLIVVMRWFRK